MRERIRQRVLYLERPKKTVPICTSSPVHVQQPINLAPESSNEETEELEDLLQSIIQETINETGNLSISPGNK